MYIGYVYMPGTSNSNQNFDKVHKVKHKITIPERNTECRDSYNGDSTG